MTVRLGSLKKGYITDLWMTVSILNKFNDQTEHWSTVKTLRPTWGPKRALQGPVLGGGTAVGHSLLYSGWDKGRGRNSTSPNSISRANNTWTFSSPLLSRSGGHMLCRVCPSLGSAWEARWSQDARGYFRASLSIVWQVAIDRVVPGLSPRSGPG